MFAVIRTGGKQYKVAKNDIVTVEKLAAEVGSSVTLEDVLLVGGDGAPSVGTPGVKAAQVTAEIVDQGKDRTITVFKKKRRKNYRRTHGHRQRHTVLKITDIALDGKMAADTDEAKAKQASQKAGAKSQKQATQQATTAKSKAKSVTTRTRTTQSAAGKSTQGKAAQGKSAQSKSADTKTTQSKSAKAKTTQSKSGKAASAKSSGGSKAKKSEE